MQTYTKKLILSHPLGNYELSHKKTLSQVGSIGLSKLQHLKTEQYGQERRAVDVVQMDNTRICVYSQILDRNYRRNHMANVKPAHKAKKFNGELSFRSKMKMTKIINTWIASTQEFERRCRKRKNFSKPLFTFITLTLSAKQVHSDNEIKHKLLNHFLTWFRTQKGVKNFIWKAEKQENGNIHFHIIGDQFIHHKEIKRYWNICQNVLGYIDRFEDKNGHREPNSTDIHQLKNIENPAAYITKYFTKNGSTHKVEGRIWSCSKGLTNIKRFEFHPDWKFWLLVDFLKQSKKVKVKEGEGFLVITGNLKEYIEEYLTKESQDYKDFLIETYKNLYENTG